MKRYGVLLLVLCLVAVISQRPVAVVGETSIDGVVPGMLRSEIDWLGVGDGTFFVFAGGEVEAVRGKALQADGRVILRRGDSLSKALRLLGDGEEWYEGCYRFSEYLAIHFEPSTGTIDEFEQGRFENYFLWCEGSSHLCASSSATLDGHRSDRPYLSENEIAPRAAVVENGKLKSWQGDRLRVNGNVLKTGDSWAKVPDAFGVSFDKNEGDRFTWNLGDCFVELSVDSEWKVRDITVIPHPHQCKPFSRRTGLPRLVPRAPRPR